MNAPNTPIAVSARELTKRFGDFTAVDRVVFEVAEGEVFGFLGPNGAGKTTTIKMLTGLLPPTSGEGRVAGIDVAADPDAVRHHIGYMSQAFSLYTDLTVEENLKLFGRLYGVPRERRAERRRWAIETAGLTGALDRLVAELPLGFKQRLALGAAVLHEPPILFLDEPTSGVDPLTRRRFWDLIYELAENGTTVLTSTHSMDEAEHCTRLALMNRGKLIALGTPAEVRSSMDDPLLEVRVSDAPRAAEILQTRDWVASAGLFGRLLHVVVEDAGDAERRITEALEPEGVDVESVRRVEPSLEDAFISLVRAAGGAPTGDEGDGDDDGEETTS